ncbi:hypothetical protein BDZ89DRAFT_1233660 [Hymenopellis radicata]|nr:hypothetical protein BDZ89DRAFT_1233660 [Hymenopellis radicata]
MGKNASVHPGVCRWVLVAQRPTPAPGWAPVKTPYPFRVNTRHSGVECGYTREYPQTPDTRGRDYVQLHRGRVQLHRGRVQLHRGHVQLNRGHVQLHQVRRRHEPAEDDDVKPTEDEHRTGWARDGDHAQYNCYRGRQPASSIVINLEDSAEHRGLS